LPDGLFAETIQAVVLILIKKGERTVFYPLANLICDTNHSLVVAKVREKLAVSK